MKVIWHWLILSVAVWVTNQLSFISGISLDPAWSALIVGACLVLVNMFIKPVINLLTLPLNLITLGLFSLIVNGAIFWYLGSGVIQGFSVNGFNTAFVCSIIISILNWLISKIFRID